MGTQSSGPLDDPRLLSRLVDMCVTLNSSLEPDQVLRGILTTTAELLECEAASVLLYNAQRGDLGFMAASGPDHNRLAEIPVPLEGSLAGHIFRTGEVVISNDVANDPRHFKKVGEKTSFAPRTLLGVPLRRGDQTTGVLEALNKRHGGFTEADSRVLSVVASQAAVAMHNVQLVQDLKRAHAELSRVDKVKSRFMALASHELRTPLAIITNYAESLIARAQGTVSAHAGRVLQAALRQREIIESLTNMNLLELGTMEMNRVPLPLPQVLRDVCSAAGPDVAAKGLQLNVLISKDPIEVNADAALLPMVFKNVLSNAVRFTPAGGTIDVMLQTKLREGVVSVRDTGIGIPAGELVNIFKDFYQVQDHMTRRHGGLGLGLAIARKIVELHGGRIWAESGGGDKGATVHVMLPRAG
jgi:signal transduction histidine kinase